MSDAARVVAAYRANVLALRAAFRGAVQGERGSRGVTLSAVQQALGTPFVSGASAGTRQAKAVGWQRFLRVALESDAVVVPMKGTQQRGDLEGLVRL